MRKKCHSSYTRPNIQVPEKKRTFAGLLVRKERWGLSWRGRVLVLFAAAVLGLIVFLNIHSFLAVTNRQGGNYLVVEGWIHYVCFEQAAQEFRSGRYKKLVTSGARRDMPSKADGRDTYADYAAEQLKDFGMTDDLLQPVPCRVEKKDRTYNSALAVKKWFEDNGIKVNSLDIVSEGPHARRSRLLYQKAFGSNVKIGIIALADPTYDPEHWWRSSEGVRETIGETVAYLYAKLLFSFLHGADTDAGMDGGVQTNPNAASAGVLTSKPVTNELPGVSTLNFQEQCP